jgi:hypothetical protein
MRTDDHPDCTGEDHRRRADEDEQLHQGALDSGGRTP